MLWGAGGGGDEEAKVRGQEKAWGATEVGAEAAAAASSSARDSRFRCAVLSSTASLCLADAGVEAEEMLAESLRPAMQGERVGSSTRSMCAVRHCGEAGGKVLLSAPARLLHQHNSRVSAVVVVALLLLLLLLLGAAAAVAGAESCR